MGGGPAVDDAFLWMIERAGGGNFVVIRAAGSDAYNAYIHALGGVASVETLVIPSREAADNEFVLRRVRGADALLIAGGDQSDYVNFWKDSGLEREIHALASRGVPIAGSSAGLAVMGEYSFSAARGSIRSATALADPFDPAITLSKDFLRLPYLDGVIADSHFDSRNRIGRLIVFMSRLMLEDARRPIRGIGVDVGTALMVENGRAELVGEGAAYFLEMRTAPETVQPNQPLTQRDIRVQRLTAGGRFDIRSWSGSGDASERYSLSVVDGDILPMSDGQVPPDGGA